MNRYDDRARLVFHFAREEGAKLGHAMIGPEHLLLGIMREGGDANKLLSEFGATLKMLRREVENMVGRGDGLARNQTAAITPRARRVMELAGSEALSMGEGIINPSHILLGIIREGDGVAYRLLQRLCSDLDTLRWRILADANTKARTEPVAISFLHGSSEDEVSWAAQLNQVEDHVFKLERDLLSLREALTMLRRSAPRQPTDTSTNDTSTKRATSFNTVYYGVKYFEDGRNYALTKERLERLEHLGFTTRCALRDLEDWGAVELKPAELMRLTFKLIDESDLVLLDVSEKGVGLGIEAGYARALAKPVVVVALEGTELSTTLQGTAAKSYFYRDEEGLSEFFSALRETGDA